MTIKGYKIGAKLVMGIVLVGLILLLVTCGPAACNAYRGMVAQNRLNQGQMDAQTNSSKDAIATQGNVSANAQASEELTAKNREDIRNAKGADQSVDPAVRDAGFASLCKRSSFANSPRGRLRCAPAPGVAPTR